MDDLPRRVFVSYAPADRDTAVQITSALRNHGVDAWIDAYIEPGETWSAAIKKQMEDADAFIILVGPHQSERNRFEQAEVQKQAWADETKKVLPVLLGDAQPPGFLRDHRAARLNATTWEGLEDILRFLQQTSRGSSALLSARPGYWHD